MDQKKLEQVRKDTEDVQKMLIGKNAFEEAWEMMKAWEEGKLEGEPNLTPNEKIHGKVVERRFGAYHDINIYEDGYEEYIYIGD